MTEKVSTNIVVNFDHDNFFFWDKKDGISHWYLRDVICLLQKTSAFQAGWDSEVLLSNYMPWYIDSTTENQVSERALHMYK